MKIKEKIDTCFVLIIEDNPGDIRIIEEYLKEADDNDYEIKKAANLNDGLKLLSLNYFDVLILDLGLPDSSELETLFRIREIDNEIAIVVLTIISNEEIGLKAIKNGAQDFLSKEHIQKVTLQKSIKYAIERKKLEKKFEDSLHLFEATFEQAAVGMAHITLNGEIILVNEKYCDILGYSKQELLNSNFLNLIHPDEQIKVLDKLQKLKSGEQKQFRHESRMICKDGMISWVYLTSSLITKANKTSHLFIVLEDINYRKGTELQLKQLIKNHKSLTSNSPDAIIRYDTNLNYLYINPVAEKILKADYDELVNKNFTELHTAEENETWLNWFKEIKNSGKKFHFDSKIKLDGKEEHFETILVPEYDENNHVNSILSISRNITERVNSREEIQNQKNLLDLILDAVPVGVWISDEDGTLISVNKMGKKIWGGEKLISINELDEFKGWWPDSGKRIKKDEWALYKTIKTHEIYLDELIDIECFDGTKKRILNSVVPILDNNGKFLGAIVVNQDITKIKNVEDQLKHSLDEKEMLIKETHHRIKNNLQIVNSILNLQSSYLEDPKSLEIFRESQNKIRSISLIHEKLYNTGSVSNIDAESYLDELIKFIFSTFSTKKERISLELDIDQVNINSSIAIYIGLIASELITNILKYAFPEFKKGKIEIRFKKLNDKEIKFTVKDDGIGLPADLKPEEANSFGFELVASLTSQLSGTLEIKGKNGTEINIVFPSE